jgi:hypothetical protein
VQHTALPAITCTRTSTNASFWAGLADIKSRNIEQAGVQALCRSGHPHYAAWWQLFPALRLRSPSASIPAMSSLSPSPIPPAPKRASTGSSAMPGIRPLVGCLGLTLPTPNDYDQLRIRMRLHNVLNSAESGVVLSSAR